MSTNTTTSKTIFGLSMGRILLVLLFCFAIQHILNLNGFLTVGSTAIYNNILNVGKECANVAADLCEICTDALN